MRAPRRPAPRPTLGGFVVAAEGALGAVVVKPAGVASEMRADPDGRSLLARARAEWPQARLPHRLDRVTSGLQVVARDAGAVAALNAQVAAREWTKHYVARVATTARPDRLLGRHQHHLRRTGRVAEVVRSGGRRAVLHVLAVEPDPAQLATLQVLVRLETGRYHQVRAQLAALDVPLVGDERYGGRVAQEGPWLEAVALAGIDLGDGPRRVVLPVRRRRVAWTLGLRLALERDLGDDPSDVA